MQTRKKAPEGKVLKNGVSESGDFSKSIIKCECGAEILFVSDSNAMSKAIEEHAETHRKAVKDCSKTEAEVEGEAELEAERIKDNLSAEALKIASRQKS
jgi:hypothetical protein